MAEGIKDKVAIIGMGCTAFGEHWGKSADDLMVDAYKEALEDAGIEPKDIQAAWQSNQITEVSTGHSALPAATALKLPFIPVTHVENYCSSGTEAFRGACYAVASGAVDIAMAVGVEKLKDTGYGGLPEFSHINNRGPRGRIIEPNMTAPGMFAQMATRYFDKYNLDPEEGKRIIAQISVKSHHNGNMNPRAHLHREITVDDVLNAPIVSWPLGLSIPAVFPTGPPWPSWLGPTWRRASGMTRSASRHYRFVPIPAPARSTPTMITRGWCPPRLLPGGPMKKRVSVTRGKN